MRLVLFSLKSSTSDKCHAMAFCLRGLHLLRATPHPFFGNFFNSATTFFSWREPHTWAENCCSHPLQVLPPPNRGYDRWKTSPWNPSKKFIYCLLPLQSDSTITTEFIYSITSSFSVHDIYARKNFFPSAQAWQSRLIQGWEGFQAPFAQVSWKFSLESISTCLGSAVILSQSLFSSTESSMFAFFSCPYVTPLG